MAILTTSYLSQSFGALDVFSGVSVSIPREAKIGLVGPNGVGKTTLLLTLAGFSTPTSGQLNVASGASLGYLPQEATRAFEGRDHTVYQEMLTVFEALRSDERRLRQMEAEMETGRLSDELLERYSKLQEQFELAGGYEFEVRIKQVLSGLSFDQEDRERPLRHLSGGQKTRVLLARLLLEEPDLLILDEPTNHLDVEAMEWLEGTLKAWSGAVLIVSHDRYFLDKIVNTIWEMRRSGIETYRGNYSAYVQQRQERWQRQQQTFEALKERLHKEMDFIRRNIAGQRTQMAQGKLRRLSREVEAIHAGGLDVIQALHSKGWLQVKEAVGLDQRPAATVAELQQRINELKAPSQPLELNVTLRASQRSGDIVMRTRDLQIGYPDTPLFTADKVELHRQECAALIGPNGTGKTTFLRTILGYMDPLSGSIQLGASLKTGYFAQAHEGFNPDESVLDALLRHRNMNISEARNYLARYLFRQDDVYKRVGALSGGERGRLALAILALQGANFLLLDEPTNHLDIPAQESLQAALEQFQGTILMVSHDRYLVNRLATQIWHLRDGRLHVYKGNYQQFLERRQQEVEAAKAAAEAQTEATAGPSGNGSGSNARTQLSKNALRQQAEALAQVESDIGHVEATLARISKDMEQATQDQSVDKIRSLSIEYAAMEEELARLMEKWEKLAHE